MNGDLGRNRGNMNGDLRENGVYTNGDLRYIILKGVIILWENLCLREKYMKKYLSGKRNEVINMHS